MTGEPPRPDRPAGGRPTDGDGGSEALHPPEDADPQVPPVPVPVPDPDPDPDTVPAPVPAPDPDPDTVPSPVPDPDTVPSPVPDLLPPPPERRPLITGTDAEGWQTALGAVGRILPPDSGRTARSDVDRLAHNDALRQARIAERDLQRPTQRPTERGERAERAGRVERVGRVERAERGGRAERAERGERVERVGRGERVERADGDRPLRLRGSARASRTPQRVRVTSSRMTATARAPVRTVSREINEQTGVGEVYLRSLLRAQLRLGLSVIAVLVLALGTLPVVFAVIPRLGTVRLFSVPLPWLLVGVSVYPLLLGVAWWHVLAAERAERDFAAIVESD